MTPSDRRVSQLKDALRELLDVLDAIEADPTAVLDVDEADLRTRLERARLRGRTISGGAVVAKRA